MLPPASPPEVHQPAQAAARWQVQLLGRVQASSAQGQISRWPTRAVALLLARLALAPQRAHAREELVELLWPGLQAAQGRARLRQALSQLRSLLEPAGLSLPPVLLADRQTVRLAPGALSCDALQFEHCVASGQLKAARALYLGDLMPGHYDNWVQSERLRLQGLFDSLDGLVPDTEAADIAAAQRAGQPSARLSASLSAPSSALSSARSLPAGPASATVQAPGPVAPFETAPLPAMLALGTVPSYWTRAFGRSAELRGLRQQLLQARLVTVLGPGGSGKTRLASELVRGLIQGGAAPENDPAPTTAAGFERVLFVALDHVRSLPALRQAMRQVLQPVWPARAARAAPVARAKYDSDSDSDSDPVSDPASDPASDTDHDASGDVAHGAASDARVIAEVLAAQPTLAVLDNVEQLLPEAEQVLEQWLRAVPRLHLLLTSRRRLGLDGEQVFELPALELAPPDAGLDTAAANPAVALFVDRAQASRPDFHLTVGNLSAVVGLTRVLGGMPLAIELAASRLRAMNPAELLQRLCAGAGSPQLDLLSRPVLRAGLRSRHASMRLVVDWSWQQLRPEPATLLRAMSALAAPASAELLAQAGAALLQPGAPWAAVDVTQAQTLIAEALESSLLVAEPLTEPQAGGAKAALKDSPAPAAHTLYRLLPPVREFALEQCTPAQARQVRSRLRRWLAAVLQGDEPLDAQALRACLPQVPPLILIAPADEALDEALDLALAMRNRWLGTLPGPAVQEVLHQALAAATDAVRRSGAHRMLSSMSLEAGHAAQAMQHALQALRWAPDALRRARAQVARSVVWLYQGRPALQVRQWLADAWVDAEASGDARVQITVLRAQALLAVNEYEDYAAAEPLVRRCLQLCEQCGDWTEFRIRQLDLATCLGWTGREAAAQALLQQSLAAARAAAEPGVELPALVQLGRVHLRQRAWAEAEAVLLQAARKARDCEQRAYLLWALLHLPAAWAMRGRAETAALLQGYSVAVWQRDFGRINRIETRDLRRSRRLLSQALGAARVQALLQAGGALGLPQVLAWLDAPAVPPGPGQVAAEAPSGPTTAT